ALQPQFDPYACRDLLCRGIPACPGVAVGRIAFTSEEAQRRARKGDEVVLVRREASPSDFDGIDAAKGVVTSFGGGTSHAALMSRQLGKPAVVGAHAIDIDYSGNLMRVGDRVLGSDDEISIDGGTGEVFAGCVPVV